MKIRERIAKVLFGDVLEKEAAKAAGKIVTHVEGIGPEDSMLAAKMLFNNLRKEEIQKSSKQIVGSIYGLSPTMGLMPDIDFEIFNQIYEQTSWVRAVVGVISKAVTARGWTLVPCKPNADPKNVELLTEFFLNCNPNVTFLEILDDITRDEYIFGNAFLEVVRDAAGKIAELWSLDATTMRVKADLHANILGYVQVPRIFIAGSGVGGSLIDFAPNEVVHFKLGSKGAQLYGLSPLVSLILPITVDKYAQIYNRAFFINGAKIRGAFIMKDATPEQVERNREYLQARAKNPDLAQSDLVLEGAIEFKQIGVNQKDMEFLQLREFTRNEILAVYGVPPSKVSIIETGNIGAGTGEHQTQSFYEETILPHQIRVAEKITKHIIREGFGITDWIFAFNRRSIDEKDQAEVFNIYLQNGVLTPDEVRRQVAPRAPELEKGYRSSYEIKKSKLSGPRKTIIMATRAVIALENRFMAALNRLFRELKSAVASKLPSIKREHLHPKVAAIGRPYHVRYHGIAFKRFRHAEAIKQLDDLEVILELVDQNKIAQVLERFSLEAARQGLELSAERSNLEKVDDISVSLEEEIKKNAVELGLHLSLSLKETIRQSLVEGLQANETISEMAKRIEGELDTVATVHVGAVIDEEGDVVRSATTREISEETAAEMIARTEANRAFNEGNLDALQQGGIEKVQWLLASDACEECLEASDADGGDDLGKTMSIDDASGAIPVHPNCRCTWISEGADETAND
jgi:HK97 family phage portal protein